MMARFHSYEPVLNALCERLRPKQILEWGPGDSTLLLARLCPEAEILSVEHDPSWCEQMRRRTAELPHVEIVYVPHLLPFGRSAGYVTYPLRRLRSAKRELRHYDLVFIDGRSRCDCLTVASLLLARPGAVVLHDADRKNYQEGLDMFPAWLELPEIGVAVASRDGQETLVGMAGSKTVQLRVRDEVFAHDLLG